MQFYHQFAPSDVFLYCINALHRFMGCEAVKDASMLLYDVTSGWQDVSHKFSADVLMLFYLCV